MAEMLRDVRPDEQQPGRGGLRPCTRPASFVASKRSELWASRLLREADGLPSALWRVSCAPEGWRAAACRERLRASRAPGRVEGMKRLERERCGRRARRAGLNESFQLRKVVRGVEPVGRAGTRQCLSFGGSCSRPRRDQGLRGRCTSAPKV